LKPIIPPYPAWGLFWDEPISNPHGLIEILGSERPEDGWALVSRSCPLGDRHLWSAWLDVQRRSACNEQLAKGTDVEMIRALVGTRAIRSALEKGSPSAGDQEAWLIAVPESNTNFGHDFEWPPNSWPTIDYTTIAHWATRLTCALGASVMPIRPGFPAKGDAVPYDDPSIPWKSWIQP